MTLRHYDADEVTIVVGPVLIDDGFADGEFVRIEQESDDFTDVAGSSGEVARSKTLDRRATITIILLQTAAANDALSVISNTDRETAGGAGVVPMMIRDRQGRALYTAENVWIMKPPDVSLDRGATSREWVLRTDNLVRFDGGS